MKTIFDLAEFIDYLCCYCERATTDLPWIPVCNSVCCSMYHIAYSMILEGAF